MPHDSRFADAVEFGKLAGTGLVRLEGVREGNQLLSAPSMLGPLNCLLNQSWLVEPNGAFVHGSERVEQLILGH
jgi:hypothetical protein